MIMKHSIHGLVVFILLLIINASCVDHAIEPFEVAKPEIVAGMEYLNEYDALKTYVNRSTSPVFKLGAGVTASEYVGQGVMYRLINANFDQITAGNAMKYGSVVQNNGSMDFGTVSQLVAAAKEADISIYGHTLMWHAQQNKKYLEGLLADKEIEIEEGATDEIVDGFVNYAVDPFTGWVGGPVRPVVENGVLVVTNPEALPNFWELQYHVANNISIKENTRHKVTVRIKGTSAGEITIALGTWGIYKTPSCPSQKSGQRQPLSLTAPLNASNACDVTIGHYVGTLRDRMG